MTEVMTKNSESWLEARSGVTNVSREWSRECALLMGVASRVANVGRKCGLRNVSREM